MDDTALAVLQNSHFKELKKAIFIDASSRVVAILNQRIKALGASHKAEAVRGDYGDAPGITREHSKAVSPFSLSDSESGGRPCTLTPRQMTNRFPPIS